MSSLPLFDDAPIPDDVPMALRLKVGGGAGAPLSAAARAYNLQLQRVHKLREQLAELEALSLSHRQALGQRVFPLRTRHQALMCDMAFLLDAQLALPPSQLKLTPRQRESARAIACSLARQLLASGAAERQADLQALHDRHSDQSLADIESERTKMLSEELSAMLGPDFEARLQGASAEEVLRAAQEHLQEAQAQQQAARQAAQAKRQARRQARQQEATETPANAKARAAQARKQAEAQALAALQGDAETSLRSLYRQLAGALHPDREPDEQARRHKTELMSEVNTAYARKDILALMELQQRVALADPQSVGALPDERLAALTHLLKAQVAELERKRASTQAALCEEFDVDRLTKSELKEALEADEDELAFAVEAMEEDIERVKQPAGFKSWLTQQRKLSEQMARAAEQRRVLFQDWDDF